MKEVRKSLQQWGKEGMAENIKMTPGSLNVYFIVPKGGGTGPVCPIRESATMRLMYRDIEKWGRGG